MVVTDEQATRPDAEFLLRAQAGDTQAFCRLVEPLQTSLLRQAAALTGDLHAAEDLVSETLAAGWTSLARYNGNCRLSTLLCAILLHRHQKMCRRARSRPALLAWLPFADSAEPERQEEEIPSTAPSPAELVMRNEAGTELRRCVERLPLKHRQIILLRFFEDASLEEMAASLGCSLGTVKSRLHHALEKLRKMKMNFPPARGDTPI